MSFFMRYSNEGVKFERTWHIQSKKPEIPSTAFVIMFQADGDELELIRTRFDNLPMAKGPICTWYDFDAQFVYKNLFY